MSPAAASGLDRIARAFGHAAEERRLAILVYITVGFPEPGATAGLVGAALEGGADVIELGVPFSDPLADGATVQRASEAALAHGVTLGDCLAETARAVRERDATVLLMGYTNPFIRYGAARLARDGRAAGLSGVIIPDLPAEESAELDEALAPAGIARIDLYAPTTPDHRLAKLLPRSRGFVYCVSLTGVTGARAALGAEVTTFVGRVRGRTGLPVAVGFGLSRPEHVAALRGVADGAVVGSAVVDLIGRAHPRSREAELRSYVASLVAAGSAGPPRPSSRAT